MVDLLPPSDGSEEVKCFLSSRLQTIPLSECREYQQGDNLGTTPSPFLKIPLKSLAFHDSHNDGFAAAEPDVTYATLDTAPT